MSSPIISPADVLAVVDDLGPPGTPFTTTEVAERFECTDRTVYNKLDALVEDGRLETKKVGARGRVWWQSVGALTRHASPEGAETRGHPEFDSDLVGVSFDSTERKEVENALRESQERLDAFVRSTSEVVYRMSPDWAEMYYLDGQQFIVDTEEPRQTWLEVYIPLDERPRVMAAIEEAIESKRTFELEHRVVRVDGTCGWVQSRAVPMLDDDGAVVEWFGTATDITERKAAEAELESELAATQELQQVSTALIGETYVESLSEHVLDAALGIMDADFASIQLYDADRDELVLVGHRGFSDGAVSAWSRVGSEHATACAKALETREREIVPDVETYQYLVGTPDLEVFRETGIRSIQTTPLVSRNGDVLGMFSTQWETTHEPSETDLHRLDVLARQAADRIEHEQTTAALRESEEKYRSLFEEMDEGFSLCEIVRDADGRACDVRYVELNEAVGELTGVSRAEAEGRLASDVFPGQDNRYFETYGRVAETGDPDRVENYVPANDRWYDVRMFPRDGDVVAVLYTDITERKHAEMELEQQAELDAFRVELADAIRPLSDPVEIQRAAARVLGERLDTDRASYADVRPDGETVQIHADFYVGDVPSVAGEHSLSDYGEYIVDTFHTGEMLVLTDTQSAPELTDEERAACAAVDTRATVAVPLVKDGRLVAFFSVDAREPREWTDGELEMVEETAERTWAAVERAHAEEELKASNDALERLTEASNELIDADPETIRDRVTRSVVDILDVEYAALWQYDPQAGELDLAAEHTVPGTAFDGTGPPRVPPEDVWETFIDDEITVEDASDCSEEDSSPSSSGSRVLVPLGRHGVIVAASVGSDHFDGRLLDLAETVAATVETAWDRAESEAELAQQNEELTRLDRLNSLIREIDQALVGADTREGLDASVCERLGDSALFEFAWVGEYDADAGDVVPRAWAGVDSTTLEALAVAPDGSRTPESPFATAIRTGERQVVADIATDAQAAPWREAALARGGRSCLCIPLARGDSVYGVLVVYSGTPQPDERDVDVLSELGETIAHTIHAVETRATQGTDSVVELTLQTTAAETPLVRLARETDAVIEFEGLVPGPDADTTVFFTVRGVAPDELVAAAEQSLAVDDPIHLADHGDASLFKARVNDATLAGRVLEHGASVRSLTIDAGTASAVVELPESADVREFVTGLRRDVPGLDLLARSSQTRPLDTGHRLRTAFEERLTPRQHEVLQLAYRSGYFESPRAQTGKELSDVLALSQSTFNYHLRGGERKLLEAVFDHPVKAE